MYTQSEHLADFALKLRWESVPIEVAEIAKGHVLDVLGISLASSKFDFAQVPGVDDLRFNLPAYAGDTIRARSVVLERRTSASRQGWGIVEWKTSADNQNAQPVLEFRRRNLSKMRTSSMSNSM